MILTIPTFLGEAPAVTPRRLPETFGQVAINCDVRMQDLRAQPGFVDVSTKTADAVSVFAHPMLGSITFPVRTTAAMTPANADTEGRFLWMDGVKPKISDAAMWPAAYDLGVPAPEAALSVNFLGSAGTTVARSCAYVYTFVSAWGDESAPSPTTAVFEVKEGQTVQLSGFSALPSNRNITKFRIYRTGVGSNAAAFQFVDEVDVSTTTYDDGVPDKNLQEVLVTSQWIPPVDDLQGLTPMGQGFFAAFRGREIRFSEPYAPYAWPDAYSISVDYPVVALGGWEGVLLILTEGPAYVAQGLSPEAISCSRLPYPAPCLSADGVVSGPGFVMWPGSSGLMGYDGQLRNLTGSIYLSEQWAAMDPADLIGAYYQGKYFGIFKGTGQGLFLDVLSSTPCAYELDFEGMDINAMTVGLDTGSLFVLDGKRDIKAQDSQATKNPYAWRSKIYSQNTLLNMAAVRVLADYRQGIEVSVFGDGVLIHRVVLTSPEATRLPSGINYREIEVLVEGTDTVFEIALATSVEELS